MRRHLWIAAVLVLLLITLFVGYKYFAHSNEVPSDSSPQASLWSQYVSQHTPPVVSRNTTVRIRFVNDVVDSSQVGKSASEVFSIEPAVDGELLFSDAREIVLRPKEYLPSGQQYRVKVDTDALKGFPSNLDTYIFDFQVKQQEFEVNIGGLDIDPDNDTQYALNGELITADVVQAAAIEKVIEAQHEGKALQITWSHPDQNTHRFSLRGIVKEDEPTQLKLTWNGDAIGVDNSGEREIEVPAAGIFTVTGAQAVQGGDGQSVVINFSERLDVTQNLTGLISLSQDNFTSRIEGSTIKLFPERGLVGNVTVTIEKGVKGASGAKLTERAVYEVTFTSQPPQVRFAGTGVILPENETLTIPIEALNVNSVQVTAFEVFDNNIGQFLQNNKLDGTEELQRVGRYLWRKTIPLNAPDADKWNRYNLDVGELLRSHPGSLFRLTLSINRGNSTYSCDDASRRVPVEKEEPLANSDDLNVNENSGWDYAEDYYGYDSGESEWSDRRDPCKDAYYRYADNVKQSRNFLASNIGLIAKRGSDNKLRIVTTDLRSAAPLGDVAIRVMNFQNQEMGRATSDGNGFASYQLKDTPFYLVAEKGRQRGYLRINDASALPVSHFDVGGEKVNKGIKGFIYGERGVWRPGDAIYLTLVLQDRQGVIPDDHPATLELYNPQGQLAQRVTNTSPVGGFYLFKMKTSDDAPTGNWTAKALLGGTTFTKTLKVETVVPNRLKVELKFDQPALFASDDGVSGKLFAQWLHGAKASGLNADVAVRLMRKPTHFSRFDDHIFDDPTREFTAEEQKLFDGVLDNEGYADLAGEIAVEKENVPGMLSANFTTRVFEKGGAFSSASQTIPFHPFDHYVGIKLPKGDATRNMLLTDVEHAVSVATVDAKGEPVSLNEVQLSLYKIDWRWWWDKSGDSLANFTSGSYNSKIAEGTISSKNGKGVWNFKVKYPDWGRYLLRACDTEGGHCTGQVVYIDWPGWAGRAQESSGVGASMLTIVADKSQYAVGETATIQLPEATRGRALVSIENGATILDQKWLELGKGNTRISLPITASMSPNVYVSVTVVQPHKERDNDRPIRLYGIVPIIVNDPATYLKPKLGAADEWRPNTTVNVEVSEEKGRAMSYTLAIVDEGLLGLTNFKTPDLHDHFFKREALGVSMWDMYDYVAGAYSGELERMLSLGGGDEASDEQRKSERKRFPPVVRFMGPFKLAAGETAKHTVDIPQYIGAVRVMVVAGNDNAYGLADKTVTVRDPLSMLVTLPRVLTPDEELAVPVSLFTMDDKIKEATLKVEADDHFTVESGKDKVTFQEAGEQLAFVKLKVKPKLGKAHLKFSAEGGGHRTASEIYIDVVSANPKSTRLSNIVLEPGKTWSEKITPHGLEGTNRVTLEISSLMPLNMDGRLRYLIQYPHGCIEQTTSSVFPQVALPTLLKLEPQQRKQIDNNINAGIDRLRSFQNSDGGFSYWPGDGHSNDWGTSYAGHFLVEAGKQGYAVPPEMITNMINYQQQRARSWTSGTGEQTQLDQAYRLYLLALAGKPESGAMNRLREAGRLDSATRWQLAAAYQLAGMPDAASELVQNDTFAIGDYIGEGATFGSALRDRAIVLNSLVLTGRSSKAKEFADAIAKELASERWYSTQSVAYGLIAIARFAGGAVGSEPYTFSYTVGKGSEVSLTSESPMVRQELDKFPEAGSDVTVSNSSNRRLFGTLIVEGVARAGAEKEQSNGLRLEARYADMEGTPLQVAKLEQGSDIVETITVTNTSGRELTNVALTHIVPSGWEIHNPRMVDGSAEALAPIDYQDIRDDRIFTYFGLKSGESKSFKVQFNSAYRGRFYQPGLAAEAMYDATVNASTLGQWVEVTNKTE
ncbi:MAG TPA: MG2 domain-containing protein [Gammaproteobacteria bacterium]